MELGDHMGFFCQTVLKGHGSFSFFFFSFFFPQRVVPRRRALLPTGLGATFGPGRRRSFMAQGPRCASSLRAERFCHP